MAVVKGSFKDLVGLLLDVNIPTFGEAVCYRPKKGGYFEIKAVFDEDFIDVDIDTEESVSTQAPRIGVKLATLPFDPTIDDKVSIGERKFKVKDCQEDGQGGATIFLTEL
jgi:hypothetical protein